MVGAATAPKGKVYGQGKGYFEYRISTASTVVRAHPESIYYLFEVGSKAKRERVDWPQRVNRQDYPQTDRPELAVEPRHFDGMVAWSSGSSYPTMPPMLVVFSSIWPKSEPGVRGAQLMARSTSPISDRARLAAGEPMVFEIEHPRRARIPADFASSGHRPASCRWTRHCRSIHATRYPLTLA